MFLLAQDGPTGGQLDLLLGPLGLVAFLLIAVVWGSVRAWWVPGWVYRDKAREAADWKALAQTGTRAAEAGVRTAERAIGAPEDG